ncbi:MAG TPA: AIR synthase [Firmicutes bacterium]|nr:AIR synthase [Bacillota bacterium]
MKIGKVPQDVLERLVLSNLGTRRSDVLVHSRIGEDCSVIDFGDFVCVVSTDPITGAAANIGWLAVHISCNDVAANGAEPVGLLITVMVPPDACEGDIGRVMKDADRAARSLGVEILGGHSEVTSAVTRVTVVSTALGKARKDAFVTSSGARPGDYLILTKVAGLEGTAILAADLEERLLKGGMEPQEIACAKAFIENISVVREGMIAAANGATAMHDVTEGGVIGAVFELCEASGVGLKVWEERIPVAPETRNICSLLGIDPLRLTSSGCMLISAVCAKRVVGALEEAGIPATVIGEIVEPGRGRVLVRQDGKEVEVLPPERDELYKAFEI